MTELYVGVDPSITNTGVVVLNAKGDVVGWFNSKKRKRHLSSKTPFYHILRYQELTDSITSFIKGCMLSEKAQSAVIAYEGYSFNSEHFSLTIGEFNGCLQLGLVKEFGGIVLVEPTRVKKFATGTGAAAKRSIVMQATLESQVIQSLEKQDKTDDICDAYFLAKIAWYFENGPAAAKYNKNHPLLRERLSIVKTIYGGMNGPEQQVFRAGVAQ